MHVPPHGVDMERGAVVFAVLFLAVPLVLFGLALVVGAASSVALGLAGLALLVFGWAVGLSFVDA